MDQVSRFYATNRQQYLEFFDRFGHSVAITSCQFVASESLSNYALCSQAKVMPHFTGSDEL
jgi:hypothetical protein